jgi:hypothetical protein
MSGSDKLSYCAASTKNTINKPNEKIQTVCPPDSICSRARPVHSNPKPAGNTRRALSSMAAMASPVLKPGAAEPCTVAERYKLK